MYNRWNLALLGLISALTIFSILVVWPGWPKRYLPDFIDYPEGPFIEINGREEMKLGLDLNGGTYVLLEADTSQLPPGTNLDDAMEGAKDVIERRINALGVGETEITREGKNRLAVQLPGIPPEEAGELIGKTALLEFREPVLDDSGDIICQTADGNEFHVSRGSVTEGTSATGQKEAQCIGSAGESGTVVWKPALATDSTGETRQLTGRYLKPNKAEVVTGIGECIPACVQVEFTGEGSLLFDRITTRLVNYPLGIFLDEELIGAPNVQSAITTGQTIITGLSIGEAKTLRLQLNTGALPVEMRKIQQQEIDATLGENTLVRTVQAGLIGILAVMFFMIVYYRVPGILASLALVTYVSTVMMIFKLFPGEPITVTLPGIAGFVLSVGMAVDANVLVFERMKEELRNGRSLPSAIEHGFDRAWTSIRDSNISTLITASILWWFGREFSAAPVTGFAIALAIGVLVSMFSAIIVTRTFLRLMVGSPLSRHTWMFAPDLHRAEPAAARQRTGF
ncbi:MAG TPA: protein translocase subunit SecD, partial [Dehalococcoidia bacterium]|nr:protein translocase subunit SecD [Dehalococcoidia bacterium]